jgi:hypothetical protein
MDKLFIEEKKAEVEGFEPPSDISHDCFQDNFLANWDQTSSVGYEGLAPPT